jgi:acyl-CoA reductase-like NAD-dependent aldehyde dehydrogenase
VRFAEVEYPFIAGERSRSGGDGTFDSIDPSTERALTRVVQSGSGQLDDAVGSAAVAQREWQARSPDRRAQALWRWGELIVAAGEKLANIDTHDIGRPIRDTRSDPSVCARATRYWAGMADQIRGDQLPTVPGHLSYTVREPLGVIAVVLPWNGPMVSMLNRVAPALACGNGVVVKPSEWSTLSAGLIAELAVEAGMPAGLLNVLPGDGRVGAALVSHPGVQGVSFTGSPATGRRIAQAAIADFKILTLEMGGKSPNIIFGDADLELAIDAAVWGVFANSGQVCCAGTRLLVERGVAGQVIEGIARRAAALRMGDPFDAGNDLGPVVSALQFERVNSYLSAAVDDGARVATGGAAHEHVAGSGYFVAPTVLCDIDPSAAVAREEVFGPVLAVLEFDDEQQAIELANDSSYGLAANVWTGSSGRMLRVCDQLEIGTIWGNSSRVMDPALPFGGFKDSGIGNAYGDGAIEGSTKLKRVSIRFDDAAPVPKWPSIS